MLLARASGLEGFARHVVIKRIHPELAQEERFVTAFLEEARIAASLHHQHIVQVHDIGDEGGAFFFAMEYVHGEDCRKLLNRVRERGELMPMQHVLSIVMATAAGLHHAHEQTKPSGESKGIIHRDVSPANILIGYDGSVKLLDFGLANAAQRSTNATSSGTLKGKSSYMSPEQCTGRPVDRRTDTFSLGIVLFELLTAQRLFKGKNDFMTMAAIVDGEIPRPSTLRPDVPPALDEIILRSLSRSPESRYQTAESMRESLEAFSLAQELRTSHKALADYLVTLFGERQEPWLEDPKPEPAWEAVETTHAGLVGLPRDPKELLARYGQQTDSPMMLAQSLGVTEWNDDDEHESTLRRVGQPTEPTQTLRKSARASAEAVNPHVRPRASELPQTAPVSPNVRPRASEPSQTAPVNPNVPPRASEPPPSMTGDNAAADELARKFNEPTAVLGPEPLKKADVATEPVNTVGDDPDAKLTDTAPINEARLIDKSPQDTTANAKPVEITQTKNGDDLGSSTIVEPPIFDGGLRPERVEDDGLDEDEPATEIALYAPDHMDPEPPVVEKMPMAMRRPPRVVETNRNDTSNELARAHAHDVVPAPLRAANRVMLPGSPTRSGIGAVGREITPPSSPLMPATYSTAPSSLAGVDPAAVAAGFNAPVRPPNDPYYPGAPVPDPNERISGFSAGYKPLVLVVFGLAIVIAGAIAVRSCDDSGTASSAAPPDAEVEREDSGADSVDARPRMRDAGVRDAGARDAGTRDASTTDAGTSGKLPPKRPLPKRPKGK